MHQTPLDAEKNSIGAKIMQTLGALLKEEDQRCLEVSQTLHKEVSGSLVACTSIGEMIRHEVSHGADAASIVRMLSSLDANLRQALQLVRGVTERQFPPVLKVFGLHVALQQLVRGISEEFAGSLVLHINGDELQLDLERRLNLYNLMQALLSHCVRHARTSWVEVNCRGSAEKLEITVDHDGGDDIWSDAGNGNDLWVVQARCLLLGTRLEVMRNAAGNSTRISLIVFPTCDAATA